MQAEYLDLAHITAKSAQESAGAGWGLVTAQPALDTRRDVYTVHASELHGFLGDIASVSSFTSPVGA